MPPEPTENRRWRPSPIGRKSRRRAPGTSSLGCGADAAGLEPLQLLGERQAELAARRDRIHALDGHEQLGRQDVQGVALERVPKILEPFAPDRHPGRRPVPSVALEVAGAGVQGPEQVKARDAAGRARPQIPVESDHHRGAMVALDHPRGHDPHHPGMPFLAGQDVAAALALLGHLRLGFPHDALLDRPPLGVDALELRRDLLGARRVLGEQQLEPRVGAPEPPGRVDPRREPKAQGMGVEGAGIDARRRHQRPQPGPRRPRQRADPFSHQPAVLAYERHQVGHRGERDQLEVAVRGRRIQRLRQLVRDPRPAQVGAWISAHPGMHDLALG